MGSDRFGPPTSGATSTAQSAREQAAQVGQHAGAAGGSVAHRAADEGRHTVAEANRQARHLVDEASMRLRGQTAAQQRRIADGLRGIGDQLRSMADRAEPGPAVDVVRRASDAAQRTAGWLDRDPGAVLNEVRDYARRNPGTFLAGAAVAGLLIGRLTRNMSGPGEAGQPGGPSPAGYETGDFSANRAGGGFPGPDGQVSR